MIRLVLAFVGLFVIWVIFFSHLSKQQKVGVVFLAVLLSVVGVWYENASGKPKNNIVQLSQIANCGVTAIHTYRSNFDISLCLVNQSEDGNIKRIEMDIIAEQCLASGQCSELEKVTRDLSVNIPPSSSTTLIENLSFSQVNKIQENIQWRFEIKSIKAKNE